MTSSADIDIAFDLKRELDRLDFLEVPSPNGVMLRAIVVSDDQLALFRGERMIGVFHLPSCPNIFYKAGEFQSGEREALSSELETNERERRRLKRQLSTEIQSTLREVEQAGEQASADQLYRMGTGFEVTGNPVLALFRYQKAIARNPDHPGALFEAGSLHFERGELDEARDLIERALSVGLSGDRRTDALNQMALISAVNGDRDEALRRFEAALAEFPEHAMLRSNYGFLLHECGDARARNEIEAALDLFEEKGVELSLGRRQAIANLAIILVDGGDAAGALSLIESYAVKDPLMLQARPDLAELLARSYTLCGQVARAEEIPLRRARVALPLGLPLPSLESTATTRARNWFAFALIVLAIVAAVTALALR